MPHIEASRLLTTRNDVTLADVKKALVSRLGSGFHVESVSTATDSFTVTAGSKANNFPGTSFYNLRLDILLKKDGHAIRALVSGDASITRALIILYTIGLLILLILGLFPGTLNTAGTGGPMDLLVFLMLGAFIIFDSNKKLKEPVDIVQGVMDSIVVEFT